MYNNNPPSAGLINSGLLAQVADGLTRLIVSELYYYYYYYTYTV